MKSEETKKIYNYCLKKFVEYYKLKNIESILSIEDRKLQEMMEDYLFYIKKRQKARSVKLPFAALELLCIVNDKLGINFKKIRKMFPPTEQLSGRKPWTTKQIQKMLESTAELRTKTLIHILSSTGCRIGAIPDTMLKHIKDMPNGCMSIIFYEGSNEEYMGFLTPDSTEVLKAYLQKRKSDGEYLTEESPLFRTQYAIGISKPKLMKLNSLKQLIQRVLKNANLRGKKEGKRYDVQQFHGFRKRFNTILNLNKEINPAVAEKLLGHKVNLDSVYLSPTEDDLFEEFQKAIPDLTINDTERIRFEKEKLEKEKEEIELLKEQVKQNKEELDNFKVIYEEIIKKTKENS